MTSMMLILVTSMKMQSRLMSAVSLIDLILSFNSKDYNGDHPEALGNLIQDRQSGQTQTPRLSRIRRRVTLRYGHGASQDH